MQRTFRIALIAFTALVLGLARVAHACDAIEGLRPLLKPDSVLMLGEVHGSEESPRFVGETVCIALEMNLSVTVALEVPVEEEARFTTYLASNGGGKQRDAVFAGNFWTE